MEGRSERGVRERVGERRRLGKANGQEVRGCIQDEYSIVVM